MAILRRRREHVDLLVVCTGNVCRSPYVAARLRQALPELSVASAGTNVVASRPPSTSVLGLLAERGIDDPQPRSRAIDRRLIESAALIVTAERMHRVQVVQISPEAAGRTFTLRELARLLDPLPDGAAVGVEAVLRRAGAAEQSGINLLHDELADPYGGPEAGYRQMADDADDALRVVVGALGATLPGSGRPPVTTADSLASMSWTTPS